MADKSIDVVNDRGTMEQSTRGVEAHVHGAMSLGEASRYTGLRPDVLKRAVNDGQLHAYVKPPTTTESTKRQFTKFLASDVDDWVRSWPAARFDAR